jgi:hypothetical protein
MGKTPGEKGNLVMFQILEDPNPPIPSSTTLTGVRTRARRIRRRRNAIATAPATVVLGASGLFLARLDDRQPEEVATSSTNIPFTAVTTLPAFDARGEVLHFDPIPAGYELDRETFAQHPDQAEFQHQLQYTRIDGANPETSGISIYRIESRASDVLSSQQADGVWATTPGGHQVFLRDPGVGGVSASWYASDNVIIQINMQLGNGFDILELVDSLVYVPADPSCVIGEVVEPYPACGEVDGREVVTSN